MPKKLRCYLRRHRWETKRGADNTTYYMCLDCEAIRDPHMKSRPPRGSEAPWPLVSRGRSGLAPNCFLKRLVSVT
jgi:hypothetical protein